jgi:hypothetical protein
MKRLSLLSGRIRFVAIALVTAVVVAGVGLWIEFQPAPSPFSASNAPAPSPALSLPASTLPPVPSSKPSALGFGTPKPSVSLQTPQALPRQVPQTKRMFRK